MSWRSAARQLGAAAAVTLSGGIAYGALGGFYGAPAVRDEDAPQLSALDLPSRGATLRALSASTREAPLDVLVIGGGATGTGAALDAATRGLRTALVEQADFGAGSSSRSTKLVHGGVRYLEKAVFNLDYSQLRLVFDALHERRRMLDNAPHLSRPLPIMTPCYAWWEVPYYWAGLKAYDLVANVSNLAWSRFLSAAESMRRFPTLAPARADGLTLKGTIEYYDGQFDDARYALALAQTAALQGAAVLNYCEVVGLLRDPENQRICGATVRDVETGRQEAVHARVVLNATGPFTDGVRRMAAGADVPPIIRPSAGIHVTLPDYYSPENVGMIVPKTADGRVVFMLPWAGATIAGTTDAPAGVSMTPQAAEADVEFVLNAIEDFLSVKVRREDVTSVWSGLRPLAVDPNATNTADVVRDHLITTQSDGLVTVTGGKWTTYRLMAQEAVDAAVAAGGLEPPRPCTTANLRLLGAQCYDSASFAHLAQAYRVPHRSGHVNIDVAKRLASCYGDQAPLVTAIAQRERLSHRLVAWHDVIEAEVVYAARHEMCRGASDFLARRCRLAFTDVAAARAALPRVVELLARELGWSRWGGRRRRELQEATRFLDTFEACAR